MKAMILAAGLGTRLRPLTDSHPKPLLPINQEPLIAYTLRLLRSHGIQEVIINLHHQGQQIVDFVESRQDWGLKFRYSHEPTILGTGGGLQKVEPYLCDEPFILINGDILVDVDLDQAVTFHRQKEGLSTLVLREDPEPSKWGTVGLDTRNQIRQIRGHPEWRGERLRRKMFAGIHVLDPAIFRFLPRQGGESDIMETYIRAIGQGNLIHGYIMDGYWMDIGTLDRYRKVQRDFEQGEVFLSYLN